MILVIAISHYWMMGEEEKVWVMVMEVMEWISVLVTMVIAAVAVVISETVMMILIYGHLIE